MENALKTIILIALTSTSLLASAYNGVRMTGVQFEKLVHRTQSACPSLKCKNQPLTLNPLKQAQISRLDAQTRAALAKAMNNVADIWPDTILEGGYNTNFKLRMDQIEAVVLANQIVGYRFTFSAEAWDENENRTPGRIVEHGFLSQDLSVDFRDEAALAEFHPTLNLNTNK